MRQHVHKLKIGINRYVLIATITLLLSFFYSSIVFANSNSLRSYLPSTQKMVLKAFEKTPQFLKVGMFQDPKVDFRVPIFMYHSISDCETTSCIPEIQFRKQIDGLLAKGTQFITMSELLVAIETNQSLSEKTAILTFDDGYEDNFTVAYPYLMNKGVRGTIFVVTSTVNTKEHLTWQQMKLMTRDGWDLQSHTHTHARLTELNNDQRIMEINKSKTMIETQLKNKVQIFCYPFGSYSAEVIDVIKKAGYRLAVTVKEGVADETNAPLLLNRIRVDRYMSADELWNKAFGGLSEKKEQFN